MKSSTVNPGPNSIEIETALVLRHKNIVTNSFILALLLAMHLTSVGPHRSRPIFVKTLHRTCISAGSIDFPFQFLSKITATHTLVNNLLGKFSSFHYSSFYTWRSHCNILPFMVFPEVIISSATNVSPMITGMELVPWRFCKPVCALITITIMPSSRSRTLKSFNRPSFMASLVLCMTVGCLRETCTGPVRYHFLLYTRLRW